VAKEEIDKEVDKFAKTLAVFMNQELNIALEKGSKGSGNPQDADLHFTSNVILTQGGYTVQVVASGDYWEVIEKGRGKGKKMPPTDMIEGWIRKNSIDSRKIITEMKIKKKGGLSEVSKSSLSKLKKSLSYDGATRQLSYVFARAISKNGIEPKPYIDNAFKRMDIGGFAERMATLLGNSITIDLNFNDEKINLSL
jgi:hypothetical protein